MQSVLCEIRRIKFTQLRQSAMLQEIRNAVCSAAPVAVATAATAAANLNATLTASSSSNSAGGWSYKVCYFYSTMIFTCTTTLSRQKSNFRFICAGASTRRPAMQPFTTLPLRELDDMMNLETEITMSTSRRSDLVSCHVTYITFESLRALALQFMTPHCTYIQSFVFADQASRQARRQRPGNSNKDSWLWSSTGRVDAAERSVSQSSSYLPA